MNTTLPSSDILHKETADCQAPSGLDTLAHRKPSSSTYDNDTIDGFWAYGVPAERRILSPGLFNKRFDQIRRFLVSIELTTAEREGIMRLLRLFCYYGRCYPKAAQIAEDVGCSRRSFWRVVAKLSAMGLIEVFNRFHQGRQISNCYRLDKLVVVLAQYLAEHGQAFAGFALYVQKALGDNFWGKIRAARIRLRDPVPVLLNFFGTP